jgi:uncharacterized protein (DUF2235 family)
MPKKIILCCDGTGQKLDVDRTNVAGIFSAIDRTAMDQLGCYDPGIGTIPLSDAMALSSQIFSLYAGKLVGFGLLRQVTRMYEFLIDQYCIGDKIYLFGFSRGAFAVRVLAGLLYRCGVLPVEAKHLVPYAIELYKPHRYNKTIVKEFRHLFGCHEVKIEFLGIWDTVKSFGYIWPRSLPHTRHNPIIKTVRHALALDEERVFFVNTCWGGLDLDRGSKGGQLVDEDRVIAFSAIDSQQQDILEVWFPGSHSDIGGGHIKSDSGIARISLRWMMDEARKAGLAFKPEEAKQLTSIQDIRTNIHNSSTAGWSYAVVFPRLDLDNRTFPPTRRFQWGPIDWYWTDHGTINFIRAGKRKPSSSQRNGKVAIHTLALELYARQHDWKIKKGLTDDCILWVS